MLRSRRRTTTIIGSAAGVIPSLPSSLFRSLTTQIPQVRLPLSLRPTHFSIVSNTLASGIRSNIIISPRQRKSSYLSNILAESSPCINTRSFFSTPPQCDSKSSYSTQTKSSSEQETPKTQSEQVTKTVAATHHNERAALAQGQADKSKEISMLGGLVALWPYVWPKHDPKMKFRVTLAIGCLLASKLLNVSVPVIFKQSVDDLAKYAELASTAATTTMASAADTVATVASSPTLLSTGAISVLLGYGIARAAASLTNELRSALFAKVTLSGIYQITTNLFRHLLQMDMKFHAEKNTGALSRSIDRGTRSISLVFTMLAFNIVPTIFEVSL